MLLVATARYHHTWVRPWTRGFQSLLLCWTSGRPLGRSTYTLDHHQTQQWVRNQITENNWGCCISGRAKQPTINYNVKTKHRSLPGEVAGLQLWEVGKPGIQPRHAGPRPVLCYFFSAATIWLVLCVWPNADTEKNGAKAENNHRKQFEGWQNYLMVREGLP